MRPLMEVRRGLIGFSSRVLSFVSLLLDRAQIKFRLSRRALFHRLQLQLLLPLLLRQDRLVQPISNWSV
eukprot:SAG31_NODE_20423_length_575_cov_0.750000_1_plen_68_part_10